MAGQKFAGSLIGTVGFSALSGGVGAELTGGDFWKGAGQGAIVGLLNHTAIHITKPKFSKLLANYPTDKNDPSLDMPSDDVYTLIGGKVLSEHIRDPENFNNACALRTSRALNYSGVKIPAIQGQTLTGADGKNYFFRARDLFNWMSKSTVFGKPNISTSDFSKLNGNKGIFVMQANLPKEFGAWGHATLYNINGCMGGHCYDGPYAYKYYLWKF